MEGEGLVGTLYYEIEINFSSLPEINGRDKKI